MFRLVAEAHLSDIGSLHWEELQRHAPYHILRISIIRASMIFSFASWLIDIPIGCRHPFIKYWQTLLAKTSVTCSLLHPENESQQCVNSFSCCIFGNQGIVSIFMFITELLTTMIGKNTIYQKLNTASKFMDIGSCKPWQNKSLVV
jgi:hypothetical protein